MKRPVVVIGAGPAGLATAAELQRLGLTYRLLERGPTLGTTFVNIYDSLTLHTGKHLSHLPGMRYSRQTAVFPTRLEFLEYLNQYAAAKRVTVECTCAVDRVERVQSAWRVSTSTGEHIDTDQLVVTTGIVSNPLMPDLPGRAQFNGRVMHSSAYRRPHEFVGQRILIVGLGNSAGEIGAELARAGALVTMSVRSGTYVVPKSLGPVPAQYVRWLVGKLPRVAQKRLVERVQRRMRAKFGPPVLPEPNYHPIDAVPPMLGFGLVDCIKEGLVAVCRATPVAFSGHEVQMSDGSRAAYDVVMFATGFAAALGPFGGTLRTDDRGFALRSDRTTSADFPGLYFVGHNYDHTGGLMNIRHDAPAVAAAVRRAR